MRFLLALALIFASGGVPASTLDVVRATEIQLNSIAGTLESFREDCNRFPSRVEFLALTKDEGGGCKLSHYLRFAQLSDHWGSEIIYEVNGSGFSLLSAGSDRLRGTPDDIIFGSKEKPWRLVYRGMTDTRDDFIDRWTSVIMSIVAIGAAVTVAGLVQRRKSKPSRKSGHP